jgi:ectoine hydroxylase-related dioxygenase (phytanoyl-CoA dioxygenase family)
LEHWAVTSEQLQQYEREGFLPLRGLFDNQWREGVITWLNERAARRHEFPDQFVLEPSFGRGGDSTSPLSMVRKFEGLALQPEALQFFGADSPGAQIAEHLIGRDDLRIVYLSAFAKPAGHGSETPWHQDQVLWPNWMPTAASCWVALDPCTEENGCLQFLRGSHREGIVEHVMADGAPHEHIPRDRADPGRIISTPMNPGDAVFFGGRVWHFSEANRSAHRRLGIVAVYASDRELRDAIDNRAFIAQKQHLGRTIGNAITWYDSRPWASK